MISDSLTLYLYEQLMKYRVTRIIVDQMVREIDDEDKYNQNKSIKINQLVYTLVIMILNKIPS